MTPQRLQNYIKLCQLSGIVNRDDWKVSFIARMPDGICWVEVYTDLIFGVWFNYPAKGLQIRL